VKKTWRNGIGFIEVVVAVAILAVLSVPILGNMGLAVKETAVSQDYLLAEAVAQAALAEAMKIPVEELRKDLPYYQPVGVHGEVEQLRLKDLPLYRQPLEGLNGIRGQVTVDEIDEQGRANRKNPDGHNLLRYEVTLEWPVHPGSTQMRSYALLRMRCPADVSAHVRFKDAEGPHLSAAMKGGD
jgi:type II secretory pathway component PulK